MESALDDAQAIDDAPVKSIKELSAPPVRWLANDEVEVTLPRGAFVYRADHVSNGVAVVYRQGAEDYPLCIKAPGSMRLPPPCPPE